MPTRKLAGTLDRDPELWGASARTPQAGTGARGLQSQGSRGAAGAKRAGLGRVAGSSTLSCPHGQDQDSRRGKAEPRGPAAARQHCSGSDLPVSLLKPTWRPHGPPPLQPRPITSGPRNKPPGNRAKERSYWAMLVEAGRRAVRDRAEVGRRAADGVGTRRPGRFRRCATAAAARPSCGHGLGRPR